MLTSTTCQQRVLRALWRLSVYLDIFTILEHCEEGRRQIPILAEEGVSAVWVWPYQRPPKGVLRLGLRAHEEEEIQCVLFFLKEVAYGQHQGTDAQILFSAFKGCPFAAADPFYTTKHTRSSTHVGQGGQELLKELKRANSGFGFFLLNRYFWHKDVCSAYEETEHDFIPYYSLGLSIWDNDKMARLGLAAGCSKYGIVEPTEWERVRRWRSLAISDFSTDHENYCDLRDRKSSSSRS